MMTRSRSAALMACLYRDVSCMHARNLCHSLDFAFADWLVLIVAVQDAT
jgi:hypothetical protein